MNRSIAPDHVTYMWLSDSYSGDILIKCILLRRENCMLSPRNLRIPTSNLRSSIAACRSHFSEIFHDELIDRPMDSRHCLFTVFVHDLRPSQRPRNNRWGNLSLFIHWLNDKKWSWIIWNERIGRIIRKIILAPNYYFINNFDIIIIISFFIHNEIAMCIIYHNFVLLFIMWNCDVQFTHIISERRLRCVMARF